VGPPIVRTAQRQTGRLSRAATRVQGEVLSAGAELLICEGNRRRRRSDTGGEQSSERAIARPIRMGCHSVRRGGWCGGCHQRRLVVGAGRSSARVGERRGWRTESRRGRLCSRLSCLLTHPQDRASFLPPARTGGLHRPRRPQARRSGLTRGSHHRVLFCITLSMPQDGR